MVKDDAQLLELMLVDQQRAAPIFQPTNYWKNYVDVVLSELRRDGLRGFRAREGSYMASFGATDAGVHWRVLLDNRRLNNLRMRRLPGFVPLVTWLDRVVTETIGQRLLHGAMVYGLSATQVERELEQRAAERAAALGREAGARPLAQLSISLEGEPKHVFHLDGKPMTMSLLNYYIRYAYVHRFFDFANASLVVELGSGSGKQVEVVSKLHPNICYFLFDIPPQLYVCEQFLKAVLGERVVSYGECRSMSDLPSPVAGKVFLFGNWQFPKLEKARVDLFWNAASLQEMEPDVVEMYLTTVDKSAQAVYLNETMSGMAKASRAGRPGVLNQTMLAHYERFLPSFRRVDMRPAEAPLWVHEGFSDTYWIRRDSERRTRVVQ
jgi:putative sugar O-methyltransferase